MIVFPKLSLKYEFEITEVGGDTVAVCLEDGAEAFHGIIKLQNDSAVFMFRKLKDGIALPELIDACIEEYSEPVEQVGPVVMEFMNMMSGKNLLKSEPISENEK